MMILCLEGKNEDDNDLKTIKKIMEQQHWDCSVAAFEDKLYISLLIRHYAGSIFTSFDTLLNELSAVCPWISVPIRYPAYQPDAGISILTAKRSFKNDGQHCCGHALGGTTGRLDRMMNCFSLWFQFRFIGAVSPITAATFQMWGLGGGSIWQL